MSYPVGTQIVGFSHVQAQIFICVINRYTGGGTTTSEAIKYARENMFQRKHGMRKGVAAEIAIIITDGEYTCTCTDVLSFIPYPFTDVL